MNDTAKCIQCLKPGTMLGWPITRSWVSDVSGSRVYLLERPKYEQLLGKFVCEHCSASDKFDPDLILRNLQAQSEPPAVTKSRFEIIFEELE